MTILFSVRNTLSALAGAFAIAATIGWQPATAQPITTNEAVERLFTEELEADWFDEAFLAQVPIENLAEIIDTLTGEFGAFVAVSGEGRELTTRLAEAEFPTSVVLDDDGRFVGLFFGPPVPLTGDIQSFVDDIAALPGETSVLVITDGEVVAAHQPDLALAVGSAFKLAVLAALIDEIATGDRAWDDLVRLDAGSYSLPSGILQEWPPGTPMTLATLANLMISISDNTATDALIAVLGRERIEAETPRNVPLLTTGDMFRLKSRGAEDMAAAWIGDETARRALLEDIATGPLPAPDDLITTPILEIEWFMTANELCVLLSQVSDHPAMSINPGLADEADWARVAFKGGGDFGVINFSTLLVGHDGREHCVVATWNNTEAVGETDLAFPYSAIFDRLMGSGDGP